MVSACNARLGSAHTHPVGDDYDVLEYTLVVRPIVEFRLNGLPVVLGFAQCLMVSNRFMLELLVIEFRIVADLVIDLPVDERRGRAGTQADCACNWSAWVG